MNYFKKKKGKESKVLHDNRIQALKGSTVALRADAADLFLKAAF